MSYIKGFENLVLNPNLLSQFTERLGSMPDAPTPTVAGRVFWNTLCEYKGWKFQQNQLTNQCRILDDNGLRRAWGTEGAMISALETFAEPQNELNTQGKDDRFVVCGHCGGKVPEGNYCKDCGSPLK
ncbi:MAG TPA: hypothetical protein PKA19_06510 [Bacillota bacterium]|nr:hypothetical protein [Bacillota bacterium]